MGRLWIIQFQPSELTKVGLIVFYAGYLSDHKDELRDFKTGFVKPLIYLAIPVAIAYFIQNHLSVGLVMSLITVIMMAVAGSRMAYFIYAGLIGGRIGGGAFALHVLAKGENAGASSFQT